MVGNVSLPSTGAVSLLNLVLSCLSGDFATKHQPVTPDEEKTVAKLTLKIFDSVLVLLNALYPNAYLASLFKNATKCQNVKKQFNLPGRGTVYQDMRRGCPC